MTVTTAEIPLALRWPARLWIALLIFSGAIMLDGLENSMIAVAIPEMRAAAARRLQHRRGDGRGTAGVADDERDSPPGCSRS